MPSLSFYDRGPDRPWANPLLVSAAIVGHTTEHSTRIWVRVWKEATYCLIVSSRPIQREGRPKLERESGVGESPGLSDEANPTPVLTIHLKAEFTFATDLTAVFEVQGLQPATDYYYALFALEEQPNSWELPPDDQQRRFRTRALAPPRVTFGLYSCHMPYTGSGNVANTHMWEGFARELVDYNADFIIGCGDQVYTDGNSRVSIWRWLKKIKKEMPKEDKECIEIMRSWYRDIYRGYWGIPQVRRLYERFPNYMIWDDHEIMDGWGSYTKKELANKLDSLFEWEDRKANVRLANLMFEAARQTYIEYEHSHNPVTPPGVFDYSFGWGRYPFFVLDMRGHRDFNRKTNDKILGADQMQRFKDWLNSAPVMNAPVLFIVSPVPVVHVANFIVNTMDIPFLGLADDFRDEWEHKSNWPERNVILDACFDMSETKGKPVVFLSGDVHVAAAFKLFRRTQPGARVYQLTSSGITYASSPPGLQFVVRENGELGDSKQRMKEKTTSFRLLHRVLSQNNYGIVEAGDDGGAPSVKWHVYGNTGRTDEVMRLKTVTLD
jgi:alkaline phosphatase D